MGLHAKCVVVVVHHRYSLLTSANLTERGQMRHVEAGVETDDEAFCIESGATMAQPILGLFVFVYGGGRKQTRTKPCQPRYYMPHQRRWK